MDPVPNLERDDARIAREAGFFDKFYGHERTEFDTAVLSRYKSLSSRALYSKEYRIASFGDLRGKRILDVGCGTGNNSVLLALLGAEVVGIDVSPVAIEKATAVAKSAGVSDRATFVVQSLEEYRPDNKFDVIWIDAFLHHMLPIFEDTMRLLCSFAGPDGQLVISEPIRTSAVVRALRRLFPENVDATPDERPLEQREMQLIRRYVNVTGSRYFHGVSRINSRILGSNSYERASALRRSLADLLCRIDQLLLALPVLRDYLGGIVVLIGTPKRR
jgi:2-polyprenyl-3-methyl-5-hydroxy-6-metoxy-1,4-benzoquinol methylase